MRLSTLKSLSLILYTFILYGDSKIWRKIVIRFRGDFTVCYMAINKNATRQSPRSGVISGSIQTTFCPSIVPKKSKSDPRLQSRRLTGKMNDWAILISCQRFRSPAERPSTTMNNKIFLRWLKNLNV
jgi:hypothetical protein